MGLVARAMSGTLLRLTRQSVSRTSLVQPSCLLVRGQTTLPCAVEWKRATAPALKKKAVKPKKEKAPFKLLSFRTFMYAIGAAGATCTSLVVGCKQSLEFRETLSHDYPSVFGKIREWFTTGKLRREMTVWELTSVDGGYQAPDEMGVIVKLASGRQVSFQVPSSTVDAQFQQMVMDEVNAQVSQQMGMAWSYTDDPIIDVSFADEGSSLV